jgi:hypothetical protein
MPIFHCLERAIVKKNIHVCEEYSRGKMLTWENAYVGKYFRRFPACILRGKAFNFGHA